MQTLTELRGLRSRSQNLVMPEHHDLIMMLVSSPALDRILTELGSRNKLKAFEEDVLEALIDRALPVGYLRLYSMREELCLQFRGQKYSDWIDLTSFVANTEKLIETVKNYSQRHDLSSSVLDDAIKELQGSKHDPYEICNGTDVIEILSIGLRRVLGNKNAKEVEGEKLKSLLRVAYSDQHFCSSNLRRDIEKWQRQKPTFQVLEVK